MRSRLSIARAAMGVVLLTAPLASANLALSLNSHATISALSAQLLAHPRSQAGNKVNTWDCDPPLAAVGGFHYFLYNLDSNNNPLPQGNLVTTMRAAHFGPGYAGTIELLARSGPGQPTQYIQANSQTQQFDFTGLQELGLARITFAQNGSAPGFINEDFDVELDYDAQDLQGNFSNDRGFEHARFYSEYLNNDPVFENQVARGMMTAVVPAAYNGLAPPGQPFTQGMIDYGNDNIAIGANVLTATVATDPLAHTWISTVSGFWDDSSKWQDGYLADGTDQRARFNAIDPNGIINVTVNENKTVGHIDFADTDTVTPGSYVVQGMQVTLAGTAPSITVTQMAASSRAQFDSVIGGSQGIAISGDNLKGAAAGGGLWLTAANTWTGGTTMNNATIYLGAAANAASAASIGAATSTVTLNGNNFISNATTGTSGKITLNHNFVANAGSISTFVMGNRCDFGIPSGNPADIANKRSVTGTGTIALNLGTTVGGDRVFSDFTAFAGRLVFNGSGTSQVFVGSGPNQGFVGTGFGNAAVVVDQSAVISFQTNAVGNTVNFGSLAGASSTAGITGSSAGPAALAIGGLGTSTTFAGFISGTASIVKVGAGTLTLSGNNTYTGSTTLFGGSVVLSGTGAQSPVLGAGAAGADIRQGTSLGLRYVGGSSPATAVLLNLANGYNQPTKFSTGKLRSTGIPANRALGWADDMANSQVNVVYTAYGDANLDLAVNFNDLVILAQNYNTNNKVWAQGDFTYDGNVNFNDLVPLAQNYNTSLSVGEVETLFGADFAHDWALAMSFVPEPTSLSVIALAALGFTRRRR